MPFERHLLYLVDKHVHLTGELAFVLLGVALLLVLCFEGKDPQAQLIDVDVLFAQFFVQLSLVLEMVRNYLIQMLISVLFTFDKRSGDFLGNFEPGLRLGSN